VVGGDQAAHALVLHLLLEVARSDATITADERTILERYRRALGVRAEAEPISIETGLGELDLRAIGMSERVHVLRMMLRVAHADGKCSAAELALLRRLAGMMGLSPVQFADVHVSVERQVRHRRRTRLWLVAVTASLAVVVAVAAIVHLSKEDPSTERADALEKEVDILRERIDQAADPERAERDLEQIRQTSARLDQLENELSTRIEELERPGPSPLTEELAAVRRQLEELQARQAIFQRLAKQYAASVLLILVKYDLVAGSDRQKVIGFGTGFFVTDDGLIVTNKHVVQPWKFAGDSVRLLEHGYTLDEDSIRMTAWPGGSSVFDRSGYTDLTAAIDSDEGRQRIAIIAPDDFEQRPELLSDGSVYAGSFHAQNDADLALLEATVARPVTPLPLAPDLDGLDKLDPVMVLGFPSGPVILEEGTAESSPSLGEVRKVETSLFITAPIVPGNSGGPVVDQEGRVIGIATRTAAGEATLGVCIQSRHAVALVETFRSPG
jgi:S1-C subfamily serine protease/uncharacterized tellurite resistance protein B-like protein